MVKGRKMSVARERRKWALEMAARFVEVDTESMDLVEFTELEEQARRWALTRIVRELKAKADKIEIERHGTRIEGHNRRVQS